MIWLTEMLTSDIIKCLRFTCAVYSDQYHQRQFDLLRDILLQQYSRNKFILIFLGMEVILIMCCSEDFV